MVLIPVPSNAIVARGLVNRVCLHGLVSQRRSKLNYGVRTAYPYEGKDVHGTRSETKPKTDPSDGDEYIDTIEWFVQKVYLSPGLSLRHFANPRQDHAIVEGSEMVKERVYYFRLHEIRMVKDSIVWHEDVDTTDGLTLWSNRPEDLTGKISE